MAWLFQRKNREIFLIIALFVLLKRAKRAIRSRYSLQKEQKSDSLFQKERKSDSLFFVKKNQAIRLKNQRANSQPWYFFKSEFVKKISKISAYY